MKKKAIILNRRRREKKKQREQKSVHWKISFEVQVKIEQTKLSSKIFGISNPTLHVAINCGNPSSIRAWWSERISEWDFTNYSTINCVFCVGCMEHTPSKRIFWLIKPYLKKPQKGLRSKFTSYSPYRNRESLFLMIGITNFSRRNLKRLSEIGWIHRTWGFESATFAYRGPYRKMEMKINTEGIIENAGKIGKRISNSLKNTITFGKGLLQKFRTSYNENQQSHRVESKAVDEV